ncbi:MAG: GTP-binding protein [Methanolobus sp.]
MAGVVVIYQTGICRYHARKCPDCPAPQCYTVAKKCDGCDKPSEEVRTVSFVDAPGHETLMATMLSGAVSMDGAILVIAAAVLPHYQTRT